MQCRRFFHVMVFKTPSLLTESLELLHQYELRSLILVKTYYDAASRLGTAAVRAVPHPRPDGTPCPDFYQSCPFAATSLAQLPLGLLGSCLYLISRG